MTDVDVELIETAATGDAKAQTDLALLFLSHAKFESAVYWLELAAKQNHPAAMYLLSRCYIDGDALPRNENMGIMWITRAASIGHVLSQSLMQAMLGKITADEAAV